MNCRSAAASLELDAPELSLAILSLELCAAAPVTIPIDEKAANTMGSVAPRINLLSILFFSFQPQSLGFDAISRGRLGTQATKSCSGQGARPVLDSNLTAFFFAGHCNSLRRAARVRNRQEPLVQRSSQYPQELDKLGGLTGESFSDSD